MRINNWPIILLALEHVIKHPEEHNQGCWRATVTPSEGCGDSDCCPPRTFCGTVRCIAGWIAFFSGWRDPAQVDPSKREDTDFGVDSVMELDERGRIRRVLDIEIAAIEALELDPEYFGDHTSSYGRSSEMEDLVRRLFNGDIDFDDILEAVRDFAKTDGVTPTPLIVEEMVARGIITDWVSA